ncbi:MAG: hypothetical protein K2W85_03200 [Phycisphaerales bacterium]|nr:hypothetical protein [Phycisphaerales bacterium]
MLVAPALRSCIAVLGLIVAASSAYAQRAPEGWQMIDAGRADRGPLATSARRVPIDLRVPLSFDRVYRVPGSTTGVQVPGAAAGEELYARISGGLTAVFPRSDYVSTKRGPAALIPPGTIFYIGALPKPAPGAAWNTPPAPDTTTATRFTLTRPDQDAADRPNTRVDARADLSVTHTSSTMAPELAEGSQSPGMSPTSAREPRGNVKSMPAPSIPRPDLMSETHRRDRVRAMMRLAASSG